MLNDRGNYPKDEDRLGPTTFVVERPLDEGTSGRLSRTAGRWLNRHGGGGLVLLDSLAAVVLFGVGLAHANGWSQLLAAVLALTGVASVYYLLSDRPLHDRLTATFGLLISMGVVLAALPKVIPIPPPVYGEITIDGTHGEPSKIASSAPAPCKHVLITGEADPAAIGDLWVAKRIDAEGVPPRFFLWSANDDGGGHWSVNANLGDEPSLFRMQAFYLPEGASTLMRAIETYRIANLEDAGKKKTLKAYIKDQSSYWLLNTPNVGDQGVPFTVNFTNAEPNCDSPRPL